MDNTPLNRLNPNASLVSRPSGSLAARPAASRIMALGRGLRPTNVEVPALDIILAVAPGCSFLSLGCLLEPLRYAQSLRPAGKTQISVYDLGKPELAGNDALRVTGAGSVEALDARLSDLPAATAIFFCCGFDVMPEVREPLRRLMRQARRKAIPIYGIGSATWALAEAGLLPNRSGVVHWSSLSAFRERNIAIDPLSKLFAPDPRVTTCAGELATLDLTIHFVNQVFGKEIADMVCDRFLISRPRGPEADQPKQSASLLRYAPPVVQAVAKRMGQNLENPVRIDCLAAEAGISQRQLERLFLRYLDMSPRRFYLQLQLGVAWQLCEQTDLPITEIALATGFTSSSTLSRKFRALFSVSPTEMRGRSRSSAPGSVERG